MLEWIHKANKTCIGRKRPRKQKHGTESAKLAKVINCVTKLKKVPKIN